MAPRVIGTAPKWSRIKLDSPRHGSGENGVGSAGSSGTPEGPILDYVYIYIITARSQMKTVAPRPPLESRRKRAATGEVCDVAMRAVCGRACLITE